MIIFIIILKIIALTSTYYALGTGEFIEGNPIMRNIVENRFLTILINVLYVLSLILICHYGKEYWKIVFVGFLVVIIINYIDVINNLSQLYIRCQK